MSGPHAAPSDDATECVDAVVIGAGVVGLAVARALARAGVHPVIVERERAIGQHQSSRNSEVIHAGIYYPPTSLKARACVAGAARLVAYCRARDVPHRRCGKLIVATSPAESGVLAQLAANARASGVQDLQPYTRAQAQRLEPQLSCTEALWSPSTGIVDSHALLAALLTDAQDAGASLALNTVVDRITVGGDGMHTVHTPQLSVRTPIIVNAAGFSAQAIASATTGAGTTALHVPPRYLTKGTYFTINARPFSRLVYPVPDTASLGIHVTVDMGGQVRFGPDQQWIETIDYTLDPRRAEAFASSVRRYFPALRTAALQPAYVGIRSKVAAPGEPMADFVVDGPTEHGVGGLVNLFGIESPGLTSCLPLADVVLQSLGIHAA